MKNSFKNYFLIICFALLSACSVHASADAEIRKLELPLNDITLKPGTTLKLKSLVLKMNPELDVNNLNLLAVDVLTKSRQGNGTIRLRVGKKLTAWENVPGSQETFDNKKINSYSSVKLQSPGSGKLQLWQLLVNGYIKIKKITLYTVSSPPDVGDTI